MIVNILCYTYVQGMALGTRTHFITIIHFRIKSSAERQKMKQYGTIHKPPSGRPLLQLVVHITSILCELIVVHESFKEKFEL